MNKTELIEAIAEKAEQPKSTVAKVIEELENVVVAQVKKGEKVDTLYPMDAEWKKRFEVWRKGKK